MERRESDHIAYRTHDGTKWVAKREGEKLFRHAPDGNWEKSHTDEIINYRTRRYRDTNWWTAKWVGNEFLHFPWDRPEDSHIDKKIIYLDWEGAPNEIGYWEAYWDEHRQLFIHTKL